MVSFISFNPPLGNATPRLEIRDFVLSGAVGPMGEAPGAKGADGRGYPKHMRRLWIRAVHTAIAYLAWPIPLTEADRRETPLAAQIRATKDAGTTFGSVIVNQPHRRVTMSVVKIVGFVRLLNEPAQLILSFQHMTEVNR
jgi:hypothetical protein